MCLFYDEWNYSSWCYCTNKTGFWTKEMVAWQVCISVRLGCLWVLWKADLSFSSSMLEVEVASVLERTPICWSEVSIETFLQTSIEYHLLRTCTAELTFPSPYSETSRCAQPALWLHICEEVKVQHTTYWLAGIQPTFVMFISLSTSKFEVFHCQSPDFRYFIANL